MDFRRIFSLFLCFILLVGCFSLSSSAEQVQLQVSNGCQSLDATMSFLGAGKLVDNLQAAFVFETNSQTLMYSYNCDAQMYPASLVKVMTALLVLENADLSENVTVSQNAVDSISYDAVKADLQAGEILTVEQLLYCLLVSSANDAAAVLAEHISGAQIAFVSLMNERAAELGCTATNFTNAHGLHDDQQVTTARDICRILNEALKHEKFREIFGTLNYTVTGTNMHEQRELTSNNYLMSTSGIYYDGRVTGGRSGVTADGDRCIATVSEYGNMELICIVMGSRSTYMPDDTAIQTHGGFPETTALLNLAYDGYARQQVICKDQIVRQQSVVNGDCDAFLAAKEDFYAVLPAGVTVDQLTFRYTENPGSTQAPIQKGQNMVSVQVWYNAMCVAEIELFAMNDVSVAQSKIVVRENGSTAGTFWRVVFIILLAIAVVTMLYLLQQRFRSKKKVRRKSRRIGARK